MVAPNGTPEMDLTNVLRYDILLTYRKETLMLTEAQKQANKKYNASAKGQARNKKYKQTDAGKLIQYKANRKYLDSIKSTPSLI